MFFVGLVPTLLGKRRRGPLLQPPVPCMLSHTQSRRPVNTVHASSNRSGPPSRRRAAAGVASQEAFTPHAWAANGAAGLPLPGQPQAPSPSHVHTLPHAEFPHPVFVLPPWPSLVGLV